MFHAALTTKSHMLYVLLIMYVIEYVHLEREVLVCMRENYSGCCAVLLEMPPVLVSMRFEIESSYTTLSVVSPEVSTRTSTTGGVVTGSGTICASTALKSSRNMSMFTLPTARFPT